MVTLDEIYNAVNAASSRVAEREGYVKYVTVDPETSEDLLTVEAGKRFVLLKLLCRMMNKDWMI